MLFADSGIRYNNLSTEKRFDKKKDLVKAVMFSLIASFLLHRHRRYYCNHDFVFINQLSYYCYDTQQPLQTNHFIKSPQFTPTYFVSMRTILLFAQPSRPSFSGFSQSFSSLPSTPFPLGRLGCYFILHTGYTKLWNLILQSQRPSGVIFLPFKESAVIKEPVFSQQQVLNFLHPDPQSVSKTIPIQ